MIENSFSIKEQSLQQTVDMLLLNGTLTECTGLVHGKMGIAVFFFHYARYTGNELFVDYAMDLIDESMNQIHVNSPADYEKGLAGIGVGIDYLIRNDFLDVEDDICEDFDQRMVRAVMYDPWLDLSQYDGLVGYGRYWMTRLKYESSAVQALQCLLRIVGLIEERFACITVGEQTDVYCFLFDLQQVSGFESIIEKYVTAKDAEGLREGRNFFPRLGDSVTGNIVRMCQQNRYFNSKKQEEIDIALKQIPDLDMEKAPVSMGLLNGYAGEGMLRLMALNKADILWVYLL